MHTTMEFHWLIIVKKFDGNGPTNGEQRLRLVVIQTNGGF